LKTLYTILFLVFGFLNTLSAQDTMYYLRPIGIQLNRGFNKYQEPYARIELSKYTSELNGRHNQLIGNSITYLRCLDENVRVGKVKQDISLSAELSIPRYLSLTKQTKFYLCIGSRIGLSQRQKSATLNTQGDYDIKYQTKLYIGMPLTTRIIIYGKKAHAFGIHAYFNVQRYYDYGFGVIFLFGKHY